jgi:HEAT repeat protein
MPEHEAEQALIDGLADPDPTVRMMVILALDRRDPAVSVERIVQELRARHGQSVPDPYRSPDATETVELGLDGWQRLPLVMVAREALASVEAQSRHDAVRILAQLDDPEATELLSAVLDDPDPDMRQLASEALSRVHERRSMRRG